MKYWSAFFLLVPAFAVIVFGVAPYVGWIFPENISSMGEEIDLLYTVIFVITSVVFLLTQIGLGWILWRYTPSPGSQAIYLHGNQRIELLWTVIPAVLLVAIALAQLPTWIKMRFPSSRPNQPPIARVVAKQWEWRVVYPGPDGVFDSADDLQLVNELHIPRNRDVWIDLRSMDVIHSFNLPHLRVKHDAIPGLAVPVWFDALKSSFEFQAERCSFTENDFTDAGDLLESLQSAADPVAVELRRRLSANLLDAVGNYDSNFTPDSRLIAALASGLNEILDDADWYEPERFRAVRLSWATREHLAIASDGVYLPLLNRQLLEDAFPRAIKPLNQHFELMCTELCGAGHYWMRGRLYVHDTQAEMDACLARRVREQEATR